MFSSPRIDRPWSLRARLIAALMALLFAVCVVVGTVTTFAMRGNLIDQRDADLREASSRAMRSGPPGKIDRAPRQGPGTLSATIVNGVVAPNATVVDVYGDDQPLTDAIGTALVSVPADGRPRTYDLDDLGSYRLVADRRLDGSVVVTGLPLDDVNSAIVGLVLIEVAVTAGAMLLAGGVGALIVGNALRPLRRVAATAGRVAELPLDRGEVALSERVPEADTDPRTEVGQVGAALNRMLGHVGAALAARQASETRVRQFVADASHELRTPLAAIRGYAELTRRHRDGVPDDVAHAIGRVESEAARMTRLVEDLLLLARLDSAQPLAREPVDLSVLIVDAVGDAHVAGRDHRWKLDLPEESVLVTGDDARLRQVLANLLTNARVHTPAGTDVVTRLWVDGPQAVVEVADNGPGIPEQQQPEVFERFARGDTSRSRAHGSTGLGLAIVAAVVEAHHGTVEMTSEPGRTAFAVRLPLA